MLFLVSVVHNNYYGIQLLDASTKSTGIGCYPACTHAGILHYVIEHGKLEITALILRGDNFKGAVVITRTAM